MQGAIQVAGDLLLEEEEDTPVGAMLGMTRELVRLRLTGAGSQAARPGRPLWGTTGVLPLVLGGTEALPGVSLGEVGVEGTAEGAEEEEDTVEGGVEEEDTVEGVVEEEDMVVVPTMGMILDTDVEVVEEEEATEATTGRAVEDMAEGEEE